MFFHDPLSAIWRYFDFISFLTRDLFSANLNQRSSGFWYTNNRRRVEGDSGPEKKERFRKSMHSKQEALSPSPSTALRIPITNVYLSGKTD